MKRTTMEFLVRFRDSSEHWLPWSEDLFTTVQYEDFWRLKPPLFPLIYRVNESRRQITQLNKTPITSVAPGDQVFVDLRSYNDSWYQALKLPNCDTTTYVVVYNYLRWHKKPFSLVAHCPIFKENFNVDHLLHKIGMQTLRKYLCFASNCKVLFDILVVKNRSGKKNLIWIELI